ncbi:MAG: transcriptional repressor LexA [Phycisphaerae bacterium]|nr:transcriptional repressor LexA [Phycisphaerae bacterium]
MAEKTMTPRQLQVLRYIRDFRNQNGYSPTMQEIGDHCGFTKITAFEHVGALVKKGLLKRGSKHSARSLQVSSGVEFADESPTRLPLAGRIAAGMPIEAIENRQVLDLEDIFASRHDTYALKVTGESMIDDHIADGDYVICERRTDARDGEMVVALLADGEATLKRLYHEKGKFRLQPANPKFKPIIVEHVHVQGIVIGVVRKV